MSITETNLFVARELGYKDVLEIAGLISYNGKHLGLERYERKGFNLETNAADRGQAQIWLGEKHLIGIFPDYNIRTEEFLGWCIDIGKEVGIIIGAGDPYDTFQEALVEACEYVMREEA